MGRLGKGIAVCFGALAAFGCALLFFVPRTTYTRGNAERYVCVWQDGEETDETRESAYAALLGAGEEGVLLMRDGKRGVIKGGEEYFAARATLEEGTLADLLRLRTDGMNGMEVAALYRTFGDRGYYAGEFFAFDGGRVVRTERTAFGEIFLSAGSFQGKNAGGARRLILGADADFTSAALWEEAEVEARAPYFTAGGAVCLKTAGGVRLAAVLPKTRDLIARCDFLDPGALDSCPLLETADLCGIPAERIGDAFENCFFLQRLHTTAEDPCLAGKFRRTTADCGCYVYERVT